MTDGNILLIQVIIKLNCILRSAKWEYEFTFLESGHTEFWLYEIICGSHYYVLFTMLVKMFIGMLVQLFLLVQSLLPYSLAILRQL